MTDTPAPNDMPDEIYAKRYGQSSGGTYWDKPREGETRTRYIRADLTAPEAVGGEALNWKRQKDTVFAWAAEHGFTPVESEIVDLLSALQQPAAHAAKEAAWKEREKVLVEALEDIPTHHYVQALQSIGNQTLFDGNREQLSSREIGAINSALRVVVNIQAALQNKGE